MLVLSGGQVETLFDLGLPVEVADLPRDLAALDRLLEAPGLLAPIEAAWAIEARRHGRPSVPMDRFVRLMIVKARSGWGYETLVREVSDSLHLRRFCRVALTDRVPDESTIRKLVRRLGAEVIEQITCAVIARATGREAERRASAGCGCGCRLGPGAGTPAPPARCASRINVASSDGNLVVSPPLRPASRNKPSSSASTAFQWA